MNREISTKGMTEAEWLRLRRNSIGGSDAAAIIGLNRYSSPVDIWMDKTGRAAEKEMSEAMRIGKDLEDYVARRFTEATGKRVRRKNAIIYNDRYPFAHANVDREIIGESAILECKTTSRLNLKQFKEGEYPVNYYVQVMHYMAVTGAKKAYIAALILQDGLRIFEVARDQEEIDSLMAAEERFWKYVAADEAPPGYQVQESDGTRVDLFGRAGDMRRFLQLKQEIKALEAEEKEIMESIKSDLGQHERGQDQGYEAIWRNQSKTSFDYRAFITANPKADVAPYLKTTTSRIFTIREIGGVNS